MNVPEKVGRLFRRHASLTSVRNVRTLEQQRLERDGVSSAELNARYAKKIPGLEARVTAIEVELGLVSDDRGETG